MAPDNGNIFEIGYTYYTKKGERVELQSITTNGKYVVAQELEYDDGDSTSYGYGPTFLIADLFKKAPRFVVDEEITRLNEEASTLRSKIAALRKEVLDVARKNAERLKKLSAYKGLEHIEEFIDGKVTHLFAEDYGAWRVVPISEIDYLESDGWGRRLKEAGVKLVSLFGNSKGDLTWKVNSYKDGSSNGWRTIVPCMSQEEAEAKRKDFIAVAMADADTKNEYWLERHVAAAIKYGVEVPTALFEKYNAIVAENKTKQREQLLNNIADAQAKLAAMGPIDAPKMVG